MISGLIGCLIEFMIDWLVDWCTDCQIDWLIDWSINRLWMSECWWQSIENHENISVEPKLTKVSPGNGKIYVKYLCKILSNIDVNLHVLYIYLTPVWRSKCLRVCFLSWPIMSLWLQHYNKFNLTKCFPCNYSTRTVFVLTACIYFTVCGF